MVLIGVALYLLRRLILSLDLAAVKASLLGLTAERIAIAAGVVVVNYLTIALLDGVGLRAAGVELPKRRIALGGFISFAFNLSLGQIVGSLAARLRLYKGWGIGAAIATRVAILTTWHSVIGYFLVTGTVLLLAPLPAPALAILAPAWWRGGGVLFLAIVVAYGLVCAGRFEPWSWRGRTLELVPLRDAALAIGAACVQWLSAATIVFTVAPDAMRADFPTLLAVHLAAALVGVLAHVPAGLGTLEWTYVTSFASVASAEAVVATMLAYRCLYHLLPLVIAGSTFLVLEARKLGRG